MVQRQQHLTKLWKLIMDKMFDPDFDPLQELQICIQRLNQLEANFSRLVDAHNNHAQLLKQITQQNTEILELLAWQKEFAKMSGK